MKRAYSLRVVSAAPGYGQNATHTQVQSGQQVDGQPVQSKCSGGKASMLCCRVWASPLQAGAGAPLCCWPTAPCPPQRGTWQPVPWPRSPLCSRVSPEALAVCARILRRPRRAQTCPAPPPSPATPRRRPRCWHWGRVWAPCESSPPLAPGRWFPGAWLSWDAVPHHRFSAHLCSSTTLCHRE